MTTDTTAVSEATLSLSDKQLSLPRVSATDGSDALGVNNLLKETGLVTSTRASSTPPRARPPSPTSTVTRASCATAGTRSSSWPRSRPSSRSSYLLIYGELPTADAAGRLRRTGSAATRCCTRTSSAFFDGFPRDAHPMPVLSSAVSALSTFYQDSLDPFDQDQVELSTVRLLAKLPTIAAYAYKKSVGQPFLYPDNSLCAGRRTSCG